MDVVHPREHGYLATPIGKKKGGLLSKLPPGTSLKSFHLPRCGRLIAALTLGVVVIEAADESGSLITAQIAAELGRGVVHAGPVDDPRNEAVINLFRRG